MKRVIFSFAVAATSVFAAQAEATTVEWSSVGTGCVVDSRYASNAVINSQSGIVTFASGATGNIMLTCPVVLPTPVGGCGLQIAADWRDPGDGSNAFIAAYLDYLPHSSTTATTVTSIVSDDTTNSSGNATDIGAPAEDTNYYWVNVWMYRSMSTYTVQFLGVNIQVPSC